jgi:cobalamin biosynthesis Mg chelatase CobN
MRVLTTRTAGIVAAGLVIAAALTACGATTKKVKAEATTVPSTTAAATTTTSSTTTSTEAASTTTSSSSGSSTTSAGSGTSVVDPNSAWDSKAVAYRGRNGLRVRYSCPAGGSPYSVWGTDYYTDDSSVCTAAVHSGLITLAKGGKVVIQIAPGRSSYTGTSRHGIDTSSYGSWDSSYVFPAQ